MKSALNYYLYMCSSLLFLVCLSKLIPALGYFGIKGKPREQEYCGKTSLLNYVQMEDFHSGFCCISFGF